MVTLIHEEQTLMSIQSTAAAKTLRFKKPVSQELLTANLVNQSINTNPTIGTLPLYDEKGGIIGYIPVYANETLAA